MSAYNTGTLIQFQTNKAKTLLYCLEQNKWNKIMTLDNDWSVTNEKEKKNRIELCLILVL